MPRAIDSASSRLRTPPVSVTFVPTPLIACSIALACLAAIGFRERRTTSGRRAGAIRAGIALVARDVWLRTLTIFGRRGFWPRRQTVEYDPAHTVEAKPGLWRRFGDRVLERPGWALGATVIVFVGGALGLLAFKVDYSTTTFFKKSVESVEGFEVLEAAFPPGVLAPMTMLVESDWTVDSRSIRGCHRAEAARQWIDLVANRQRHGTRGDAGRGWRPRSIR